MDKVYQVIEGYYFTGESSESVFGTYSTMEKAQARLKQLIKKRKVDAKHTFVKEIIVDVDVD